MNLLEAKLSREIRKMASNAKQARPPRTYNLKEVLSLLDEENSNDISDSDPGGMSSAEESDLDHQLMNSGEESRCV